MSNFQWAVSDVYEQHFKNVLLLLNPLLFTQMALDPLFFIEMALDPLFFTQVAFSTLPFKMAYFISDNF